MAVQPLSTLMVSRRGLSPATPRTTISNSEVVLARLLPAVNGGVSSAESADEGHAPRLPVGSLIFSWRAYRASPVSTARFRGGAPIPSPSPVIDRFGRVWRRRAHTVRLYARSYPGDPVRMRQSPGGVAEHVVDGSGSTGLRRSWTLVSRSRGQSTG